MSLFLISVEQVVALDAQNIVAVSCGEAHTLALNDKGQVYAWGLDSDGQLGLLGSTGLWIVRLFSGTDFMIPILVSFHV